MGATALDLLAASGLVPSNSEGRRKIAEGAVRINDVVVGDPHEFYPWTEWHPELHVFKVQLGKKKIVLVKPV